MNPIVDIFSFLTAAAGWYYLFYSRAAVRLEGIESRQINVQRIRLRRVGGVAMLLLGVLFFAGFQTVRPTPFIVIWVGVIVLLAAILVLALIDLRLTYKLQQSRRQEPKQ